MKREYAFSKAERGKFYRRNARMILPIYLDAALQKQLEPLAQAQGKGISEVVNQIVRNQIQMLATLSPRKRPNNTLQPTSRARRKSKSQRNPRAARG